MPETYLGECHEYYLFPLTPNPRSSRQYHHTSLRAMQASISITIQSICNPTLPNYPKPAPLYLLFTSITSTSPSTNLISMPEAKGDDDPRLPFHMDRTSLGLVLFSYDHVSTVSSPVINEIL